MCRKIWIQLFITATFSLGVLLPVVAEEKPQDKSLNEQAKERKKKGIYGQSSLNPEGQETTKKAKDAEKKAKEQKDRKYPLSITDYTDTNQAAHLNILNGYNFLDEGRTEFAIAYELSDKGYGLDQSGLDKILEMPPKKAREEILLYFKYRFKHLNNALIEFSNAYGAFTQADYLAPNNKRIQNWRIYARNCMGVVKYHIKFNDIFKRYLLGDLKLSEDQLVYVAQSWYFGELKVDKFNRVIPRLTADDVTDLLQVLPGLDGKPMKAGKL